MPQNWYTPGHLFNFSWRASRTEFFLFHLLFPVVILFPILLFMPLVEPGTEPEGMAFVFLMIVGTIHTFLMVGACIALLAVNVRRLHDQEKSGWWWLATWLPLVGWIFWLMFAFTRGDEFENLYGPNPRSGERPGASTDELGRVFD